MALRAKFKNNQSLIRISMVDLVQIRHKIKGYTGCWIVTGSPLTMEPPMSLSIPDLPQHSYLHNKISPISLLQSFRLVGEKGWFLRNTVWASSYSMREYHFQSSPLSTPTCLSPQIIYLEISCCSRSCTKLRCRA